MLEKSIEKTLKGKYKKVIDLKVKKKKCKCESAI